MYFLYILYGNDALFNDAEHVGYEQNVFLSNVDPPEIGETALEAALIILKDGLMRDFKILANNL